MIRWPESYAAHDAFVAPARAYPAIWRLIAGMVLATVAYMVSVQIYFEAATFVLPEISAVSFAGGSHQRMYLLLSSFVFMALSVGLSAWLLHRRTFATLLGPWPMMVRDFAVVLVAVTVLMVVIFILPPWDMGGELVPAKRFGEWLFLLLPSVIAVLIQVSAEEIVFRGYIQQQLAARFRSPFIWMVLPSALFAWGHYVPEIAGSNAFLIALWSGVFGILMADLTARAGSLGPAIAVHFCNNFVAIVLISMPDDMYGLALYLSPISMADETALRAWLAVDFAMMIVMWLAARLAIRR